MRSTMEALVGYSVGEALLKVLEEEMSGKCFIDGCDREPVKAYGYCSKHYFAEQMIERKLVGRA